MEYEEKMIIAKDLKKLAKKDSQSKIAKRAGVSTATISQMINGNWSLIRVEMWRKVISTLHLTMDWNFAPISNYQLLEQYLQASQNRHISIAVSHAAGAGKSFAYKKYANEQKEVIYVECKNFWTKKTYVQAMLSACGLENKGKVYDLIHKLLNHIRGLENPIIIIDQADKLKDPSLDLFMDLYNELDGVCGFILSGVPAFEKRILKGCQYDKIGYRELRSRIGSKFIHLNKINEKDVAAICVVNGVKDEATINEIYNTCAGDLRRVRRSIDQYFLIKSKNAA